MENAVEHGEPGGAAVAGRRSRGPIVLTVIAILLAGGLVAWLLAGGAGERVLGELFVIDYDEAHDLTRKDRAFDLGDVGLAVSMARPARPLEPIAFSVAARRGSRPLVGLEPTLELNMKMNMGRIAYRMLPDGDAYRAEVTLPVCMKGGKRWYGRLRFEHAGRPYEQVFLFDVQ